VHSDATILTLSPPRTTPGLTVTRRVIPAAPSPWARSMAGAASSSAAARLLASGAGISSRVSSAPMIFAAIGVALLLGCVWAPCALAAHNEFEPQRGLV